MFYKESIQSLPFKDSNASCHLTLKLALNKKMYVDVIILESHYMMEGRTWTQECESAPLVQVCKRKPWE